MATNEVRMTGTTAALHELGQYCDMDVRHSYD